MWALIALVSACVTPFEPSFKEEPAGLVIQGLISNEPGPYTIQLTRPANYAFGGATYGVDYARVYITDDAGGQEELTKTRTKGEYVTTALQGIPGRRYQIHVEADGKTYESKPELLNTPLPIERIYDEVFREVSPATNKIRQKGWKVYIDTKDPAEAGNYYRWNAVHYKKIDICGTFTTSGLMVQTYSLSCCTPCWDIVRCLGPQCVNIANDALINGGKIVRQEIATVPVECRDKYYLEIEQQSISREAYLYFKTVKRLLQNTGGVFDVAPSDVKGNLTCTTDPSETVYGYFSVVGTTRSPYILDRSEAEYLNCGLDYPRPEFPAPCLPCEESIRRTPKKPRYWNF